jgi:NADH-quinone oxidoreductase subunit M
MFPIGSEVMGPFVLWLSAIAIVYTSLVAMVQEDMKKLIAYSSVAHMGYVTMGIFAVNQQGIDGAIFQMLSHGFISGALFLCVAVIYDRMPAYALIFMFFTMANVGLPGTSGFVGEFLTLIGIFQVNTWVALVATSGVIFSAAYALWLYRRVVMGDLIKEGLKSITDMDRRERALFLPLVTMTLLLGVYPALVLDLIGPSVSALVADYSAATAAFEASMQTASSH